MISASFNVIRLQISFSNNSFARFFNFFEYVLGSSCPSLLLSDSSGIFIMSLSVIPSAQMPVLL